MNIILTGGHSGIGLELTKHLLQDEHHVGLILRNEARKQDAINALGTEDNLDFFYADLSNQEAVEKVAESIKASWTHIDGLFNNAGVLLDKLYTSPQGNEMHYEVNTLTPYALANHLKPLLESAESPFIINTVTGGLHQRKALEVDEFVKPTKFVKLLGSYMMSKLALTLLMTDLAREENWSSIRIVNVDPGPNKTNMTSGSGMPVWLVPLRNLFFPEPTVGGKKLYDGAFAEAFKGQSGMYVSGSKIRPMIAKLTTSETEKVLSGLA
ncbi:MAG: SDR family NAD(P)-dependent oxidoreductase [Deinococcota bacterium]